MLDLIIKYGECYIDDKLTKTNIGIQNGKISIIGDLNNEQSKETIDASGLQFYLVAWILKFISVSLGQLMQRTYILEEAAIAGGITSVFEMPNKSPNSKYERI